MLNLILNIFNITSIKKNGSVKYDFYVMEIAYAMAKSNYFIIIVKLMQNNKNLMKILHFILRIILHIIIYFNIS